MPIDPSRIGKPKPLGSHTTQRATAVPAQLGHPRSSPNINVPYAGIPGGRTLLKTGGSSTSSKRPRPRALSTSSEASFIALYASSQISPSSSSSEKASTASISSVETIPTIPSPPASPLPEVKPLHVRKTSKVSSAVSKSPKDVTPRSSNVRPTPSRAVGAPAANSPCPSAGETGDSEILRHQDTTTIHISQPHGTSDSANHPQSCISRGYDIKLDMGRPLEAYECLEESIRSQDIPQLYLNALEFINAINAAVSKAEQGVPEVVLRSLLSDRSNVVFPLEAFQDWLNSFPRKTAKYGSAFEHCLVNGTQEETTTSMSLSRGKIVTFTKEEEAEILEDCPKYIHFIYSGLRIYLRALMEDPEAESGSVLDKALEPREEAAVEAVKAWKLSRILQGLKMIVSLPKVRFSKRRANHSGDQTSLGSETVVSIPDSTATGNTTTTSFDAKTFKKMSLRASVLIIDTLGTSSSTDRTDKSPSFSDIWTRKNVTLTQVLLRLTDQTFAHANDLHEVLDTFWMFRDDFTDSHTLVTTLIDLYDSQPSQDVSGSSRQFLIAKILRSWTEYHWCHPRDDWAFDVLHKFLRKATARPNQAVASTTHMQTLSLLYHIHSEKPTKPKRLAGAFKLGAIAPIYGATGFDPTCIVTMKGCPDIHVLDEFHKQKEAGWVEVARALTKMESGFFLSFLPAHISTWRGKDDLMKRWTTFANSLSLWVYETTVFPCSVHERAEQLSFWIHVASHCKQLRNYSSAYHIILVLTSRLSKYMQSEFESIPAPCNAIFDTLKQYFRFPSKYREDLVRVPRPAVPIPGLVRNIIMPPWEHFCDSKEDILDPVSGKLEAVIPLAFYRRVRGLVKDLESCYQPYGLPENPLVDDYVQRRCDAFNMRHFDTAVTTYIDIAKARQSSTHTLRPECSHATLKGQVNDKQGRWITWDYRKEAVSRKAGQ